MSVQQPTWPAWTFDPVTLRELCSAVTVFSRSGAVTGLQFLDIPVPLADALVGPVRSVSMPDAISISSMESFAYSITLSNKEERSNTGVFAVRSPSLTNEEIEEIFNSEPSIDFETDDIDEVLRALEDENKG